MLEENTTWYSEFLNEEQWTEAPRGLSTSSHGHQERILCTCVTETEHQKTPHTKYKTRPSLQVPQPSHSCETEAEMPWAKGLAKHH